MVATRKAMMRSSISFETWCRNHPEDHDAKWCRELYPWEVFQRIDYDECALGAMQRIVVADQTFNARIQDAYVGQNGRLNYLIELRTNFSSKRQEWTYRAWDGVFHLVAHPSGEFITLYTAEKDPSKVVLRKFLSGNLTAVESVRSLPVSSLLFRSLISYAANDRYDNLKRFESFPIIPRAVREMDRGAPRLRGATFEPFLSKDRSIWVTYSFTEEKAHRLALRLVGQANSIVTVFCHPTFTRHRRCSESSTRVLSLSEFLWGLSSDIHQRYINQARFLINHLRLDDGQPLESTKSGDLIEQIRVHETPMQIRTSDLREAKSGLGVVVTTTGDAAYVCACANLLNAALNRTLACYNGSVKIEKEVYSFKAIFARAIDEIVRRLPPRVELYIEPGGLVYVRVRELQFTFHAVPRTPCIETYARGERNIPQEWSGLRLQPVAPLVLRWALALLSEERLERS